MAIAASYEKCVNGSTRRRSCGMRGLKDRKRWPSVGFPTLKHARVMGLGVSLEVDLLLLMRFDFANKGVWLYGCRWQWWTSGDACKARFLLGILSWYRTFILVILTNQQWVLLDTKT
ncbi:hypothetical protein HAX54_051792 [Datura stramonium]|uniref:Uncharacterized protein n=1 Tax=Datura stramonium TaxID=4076 RepID=A0ABS8RRF1_DATST|nr:hypothetical protein [Datura stramonium]